MDYSSFEGFHTQFVVSQSICRMPVLLRFRHSRNYKYYTSVRRVKT